MSLDLYLRCAHGYGPDSCLNITHNVRGICAAAGRDPWEWQGRTAREVIAELDVAINALGGRPEAFERLAPANGWGSGEARAFGVTRWASAAR